MTKTTFLLFRFHLLLGIGICREQLMQVDYLNSRYTDPKYCNVRVTFCTIECNFTLVISLSIVNDTIRTFQFAYLKLCTNSVFKWRITFRHSQIKISGLIIINTHCLHNNDVETIFSCCSNS